MPSMWRSSCVILTTLLNLDKAVFSSEIKNQFGVFETFFNTKSIYLEPEFLIYLEPDFPVWFQAVFRKVEYCAVKDQGVGIAYK